MRGRFGAQLIDEAGGVDVTGEPELEEGHVPLLSRDEG
jgi:hypothetical protein